MKAIYYRVEFVEFLIKINLEMLIVRYFLIVPSNSAVSVTLDILLEEVFVNN